MRTETGPLKIGDDWTGVFIRGDNALMYADCLRTMVKEGLIKPEFVAEGSLLGGLIELLESCDETKDSPGR